MELKSKLQRIESEPIKKRKNSVYCKFKLKKKVRGQKKTQKEPCDEMAENEEISADAVVSVVPTTTETAPPNI